LHSISQHSLVVCLAFSNHIRPLKIKVQIF
jgi:hypothetical protein